MKFAVATIVMLLIVAKGSIAGAKEFAPKGQCGEAVAVSGDQCENLKVEFRFTGCAETPKPEIVKKLVCRPGEVMARIQNSRYRWEAVLVKEESAWGATWRPNGPLKQFARLEERKPAAAIPAPFTAPHADTTPQETPVKDAPVAAPAVSPFKISGFVNFGYATQEPGFDPGERDARSMSGFNIQDAAFYANYEKDRVTLIADIAVRRAKDKDLDATGAAPNQSSNNNLAIGIERSQLYVKYKVADTLTAYAGQFDTIFGVELNDSKDRVFNKTGLLNDAMLPVTHTGGMLEWSSAGYYVKGFAANPSNQGSYGTNRAAGTNTEYGAGVGFANENLHWQIGYATKPVAKADGSGNANRAMADVLVGGTYGPFALDLEFTQIADPSKNSLTTTDANDKENSGLGYFVLATYKFNTETQLGLRYEKLTDDPAQLGYKDVQEGGISLHYKLTPDLELRSEYLSSKFKTLNGDVEGGRFDLTALFTF